MSAAGNNYAAQSSDGLVELLADRIGASGILEAFNRSTGGKVVNWILDKAGEGMEETITGFGEPLIDRITYNPKADLATADELADEFLGGVVLSLLLSGGRTFVLLAEIRERDLRAGGDRPPGGDGDTFRDRKRVRGTDGSGSLCPDKRRKARASRAAEGS